MLDLPFAARFGQVVRDSADDPATRVGRDELRDHLAQLGALIAGFDLARDADLGGEGHVDEEPAGERDLRGDARALGPDGFFDDLNELGLTALQLVGDVGRLATPGATAPIRNHLRAALPFASPIPPVAVAVPVAIFLVGVVGLTVFGVFVFFRLD